MLNLSEKHLMIQKIAEKTSERKSCPEGKRYRCNRRFSVGSCGPL